MLDPATINATAVAITSVIFTKALEKSAENLGEAVCNKIGLIICVIRDKFKTTGMEGVLTQVQENSTEPNWKFFQQALEMQMTSDSDFANQLVKLKQQLEKLEGGRQVMASELELKDFKAKDMKQKGAVYQEMLTNVKGENVEFGNLTQEN